MKAPKTPFVRGTLLLALLLCALFSSAREKNEIWFSIGTPHFTIVSNASEKQARHVGWELERMRSVFHAAFPNVRVEGSPIVVLALKSGKDFRQLEPTAYLGKGKLQLSGLFFPTPDKNYVLLLMDAPGEHPYAVVYHEYTHFLLRNSAQWIPLWLNEGLAEFYENTEIRSKDVLLGKPSQENLALLARTRPLPLETLLRVDHNSPYYHEEEKGSIFYAESWALTHYLQIKDQRENTHHILDYIQLMAQKNDPVAAATIAFGDLKKLQSDLDNYVRQVQFGVFRMPGTTEVDESQFKIEPMSAPQADAFRADFMAYSGRTKDAQPLAQQVLREEPENVLACETLGYLAFTHKNFEEAGKWYTKAVALNTQSYLAHYYFASIALTGSHGEDQPRAESSLRAAIRLNPSFAPAYDELAVYYGMRRRNLDEAHSLSLRAVELDPLNAAFRLNTARILMQMGRGSDALSVIQTAMAIASSPQDKASAQNLLAQAEQYATAQESAKQASRRAREQRKSDASAVSPSAEEKTAAGQQSETAEIPRLQRIGPAGAALRGSRLAVNGIVKDVHCLEPARLDLKVNSGGQLVALHTENYFKVDFTAGNFTPKGELKPCTDLEGVRARIEYVRSAAGKGQIVSVEMWK